MTIPRYDFDWDGELREEPDGRWVLYEDHRRIVEALEDAMRDELREQSELDSMGDEP